MYHWWCNGCQCPCDDGGLLNGKWYCIECLDKMCENADSIKGKEKDVNDSSNVSE